MSEVYLRNRWFEDIPVGEFHVFGSHTFSELEMVEFAKHYAPGPEFTDPDVARALRWGGLVASPWHLCAMWMRKMVDYMEVYAQGVNDGRRSHRTQDRLYLQGPEPDPPGAHPSIARFS